MVISPIESGLAVPPPLIPQTRKLMAGRLSLAELYCIVIYMQFSVPCSAGQYYCTLQCRAVLFYPAVQDSLAVQCRAAQSHRAVLTLQCSSLLCCSMLCSMCGLFATTTNSNSTALHCTALHCTALHCTTLHYTPLYSTLQYIGSLIPVCSIPGPWESACNGAV